ncbi:hypothetical protein ACFSOV_16890 [Pedobacter petrophilus]
MQKNADEVTSDIKLSCIPEFEHQLNGAVLNLNTPTYENAKGRRF